MFSEAEVDKGLEWVSDHDLSEELLSKYSRLYDYVFLDDSIKYTVEERDYIFFLWSLIVYLFDKRLGTLDIEVVDTDLEDAENALWEGIEQSDDKAIDILYAGCSEKELFAFLEDGLDSDEKDPENIISSKELSMVTLLKMTCVINYLNQL